MVMDPLHNCPGFRSHHRGKGKGPGLLERFPGRRHRHRGGVHHTDTDARTPGGDERRVLMVGNPNVGKSALFNRLTGRYVVVSNYPGTTVAVSQGRMKHGGKEYTIIDTPGMYSLYPITEEERVGRRMILEEDHDVVLHVVDAKNLARIQQLAEQEQQESRASRHRAEQSRH